MNLSYIIYLAVPELDIIPAVVTFGACLLTRLELGIVIGIAVNLMFLLYASARPSVKVTTAVVSIPTTFFKRHAY